MFSLIITIISIALVAALAVATIYYGGTAFTTGSTKAQAAGLVSSAQQIAGAEVLYFNDFQTLDTASGFPTLIAKGYLTAVPAGTWTVVANPSPGTADASFIGGSTTTGLFELQNSAVTAAVCSAPTLTGSGQYGCTGSPGVFYYND
jgi:type II secretory pathway pseudopilin PulG